MPVARFLKSLFAGGRLRVASALKGTGPLLQPSPEEEDEIVATLTSMEQQYREDLPGTPPRLSRPALIWGALTAFRVSSFIAYRDVNQEIIATAFGEKCAESPSPSVCYSVDLTLRFLPDLTRLARAVSPDDPLVGHLIDLGGRWPLSSVGVAGVVPVCISPILENFCLRQLYVDRVISANDQSRLNDPRVIDAVRAAIGIHDQLAPELAAVWENQPDSRLSFAAKDIS
jgi:hypothetical protein